MHDCDHIPNAVKLLRDDFLPHEIQTVHDLMRCMDGPPSNSTFRRIVMLMLRGHYASALNYPEDLAHLGCYIWKPRDAEGKSGTLNVDFTHVFDDKKPDNVPGIYVGFGGQDSTKLGIGSHHSHSEDNATENFSRGGRLVLKVHHVTASDGDSYDLAEMSNLFLLAMARVVRSTTGAAGFEVAGYAAAVKSKLSSSENHYEVVLSVEISYTLSAALHEETHRIRAISGIIGSST